MKKLLITGIFGLFLLPAVAQTPKKEVKKEVNVNMEQVNGKKILTVTTTTDGVKKVEKFEGDAADQKIQELENEAKGMQAKMADKKVTVTKKGSQTETNQVIKENIMKEVKVEDVDGVKTLTIKTIENGKESIEVFKGKEAEEKIKQLNSEKSGVKVEEKKAEQQLMD